MIRRIAVSLILGALLAVPAVSPAQPALPVPTAGSVYRSQCGSSQCGNTEDSVIGKFRFLGGLSLDGGSYYGTFGVDFVAKQVGSVLSRLRIDSAAVHRAPYPEPSLNGFGLNSGSITFGPNISGSCSGSLQADGLTRLTCSFQTATGLSGTRSLLVVDVEELQNTPCTILCQPNVDTIEYRGVYTRDYFKSL